MKDELFEELIASVKEGGAILRGEQNPARSFQGALPKNEGVETVWMSAITREGSEDFADDREDTYNLSDGQRISKAHLGKNHF